MSVPIRAADGCVVASALNRYDAKPWFMSYGATHANDADTCQVHRRKHYRQEILWHGPVAGWRTDLEARLRDSDEHPIMVAHLSKYRSLMPSLALIFHMCDCVVDGTFGPGEPRVDTAGGRMVRLSRTPYPSHSPRRYRSRRYHHPTARREDQGAEAFNALHGSRRLPIAMGAGLSEPADVTAYSRR
jgi:hypothetical protein